MSRKKLHRAATARQQSGSALFIALVLVLVSTLVGMSAMESSGIEVQLVNNDLFREVNFRAAESTSDRLMTDSNLSSLVSDVNTSITSNYSFNDKITVQGSLASSGTGIARGFSLGVDSDGFQTYKFTSQTIATIQGVNTQRVVVQGSEQLAPSL